MPTLEDGVRSWPTWLSAKSPRNRPQEQTPGTDAYAGDFGFKVLTAADPAEKTKKLNAEIANGRLAMMAIIGMFFQAGIGAVSVLFVPTHQEKKHHKESEKGSTTLCHSAWCVLSF